jgi:hypothetical protein
MRIDRLHCLAPPFCSAASEGVAMEESGPVTLEVSLGDDDAFGRVHVELGAFCEFDAWIDGHTQALIDRWAHLAAPNSSRPRRTCASRSRS